MKIRCKECQKVKILQKEDDLSEEKEIIEQFHHFNHLEFIHYDLEMVDTYILYYCPSCHSLFQSYEIIDPIEEGETKLYGAYCLTHQKKNKNLEYYIEHVGDYWWEQERRKKINTLQREEGEITLYLKAHVDDLRTLQKGTLLTCQKVSDRCELSLEELVVPYGMARWVVNCRYYVKVSVPKSTLILEEKNREMFTLTSTHLLNAKDIEVIDPYYGTFAPLKNWEVPLVYEQNHPIVDDLCQLYNELETLLVEDYKQLTQENEQEKQAWLKTIYPECFQ